MENLSKNLQKQLELMAATGKLFRANVTGDKIWDMYLSSFTEETDPIFRDPESSSHNCNQCKSFVRRYGNIVALDSEFNIMTLFDIETEEEYKDSIDNMSKLIRESGIKDVFFETYNELKDLPYESCSKTNEVFRLGINKNHKRYTKEEAAMYGVVKPNEVRTFHHMHLDLPKAFVDTSGNSVQSIMAEYRSAKDVFIRAMREIPLDTLELVKDLINQGSLLNGETHLYKIEQIIPLKVIFDNELTESQRDNWAWFASYKLPFAKFRNELIGVLCSELAEGEELNKACKTWNKRVDPANYMKAVAPITETQKKNAQEFVEENGYVESFDRRLAVLEDIKTDEIKHINVGDGSVKKASMFDNVKTSTKSRHKRNEFKEVEEVSIGKFMKDILPGCTSVEAFLENKHEGNLVTMTTSNDEDCKQMFKWSNPYSWTYKGNLAGKSMIKEAVKAKGGKIDGVLNFRLAWNGEGGKDNSDLDAWASEPVRTRIGFSTDYRKGRHPGRSPQSGQLDVDNTSPNGRLAVENITWNDLSKMKDGVYKMWVNQYSASNSQGFKAEIEFNGEIHEYSYDRPVSGNVQVAEVTLKNGEFSIKHLLPSTSSSKELYGLDTQQFHKVDLVCLSPNHWGENKTGNKHYFFMLEGCKSDSAIRSFHSENLEDELAKHRKVLEVLGAVNMLDPTDKQLSGLGFNATVKDEIILRLKGNFKRVIKVKF